MNNFKDVVIDLLQITIGVLFAAVGLNAFLLPNGFLDGGITGVALLTNLLTDIDISWLLLLMNIPFLIIAYYVVSKWIFFKSIFSIIGLAIFVHWGILPPVTDDKLLIAIFGGIFLGMGIGITIRGGAVLDGTEVLGIYLNDRFGISIGKFILVFNIILFGITIYFTSWETGMYSILTFIVTAKITDSIIEGFEDFIGLTIISKESAKISKAVVHEVGAGVTVYKGQGGYGSHGENTELEIIHSIINRIDLRKIHRVVDRIDPKAFVVEFDVNNVQGGILRKYLSRKAGN
ncbi:MAG: YitT family protein [Lewinella sp.]|jgi:uncharacterized membrane-anchored protein YitT (DUF2179 family)|uniref:YitT family protein n=1 Tax=Lewinella sp. TaxID=2004506 RepID=UPI003D6C4260